MSAGINSTEGSIQAEINIEALRAKYTRAVVKGDSYRARLYEYQLKQAERGAERAFIRRTS